MSGSEDIVGGDELSLHRCGDEHMADAACVPIGYGEVRQ